MFAQLSASVLTLRLSGRPTDFCSELRLQLLTSSACGIPSLLFQAAAPFAAATRFALSPLIVVSVSLSRSSYFASISVYALHWIFFVYCSCIRPGNLSALWYTLDRRQSKRDNMQSINAGVTCVVYSISRCHFSLSIATSLPQSATVSMSSTVVWHQVSIHLADAGSPLAALRRIVLKVHAAGWRQFRGGMALDSW